MQRLNPSDRQIFPANGARYQSYKPPESKPAPANQETLSGMTETIRKNPLASVLIGLGVGLLLARLIKR